MAIGLKRSFKMASVIAVAGLSACAGGSLGDPAVVVAIKAYYAAHATEEKGSCRSPQIDTIQARQTLATSSGGEEVMLVRYSYFDRHADMDAAWDKLVHLSQPCGGISERRFVLAKGTPGYRVIEMSGESQGREITR
jgi:hypothetical protein